MRPQGRRRRLRNTLISGATVALLVLLNAGPWSPIGTAVGAGFTEFETSRADYIAKNGHWDVLDVPGQFKVNAIHAAVLSTGKVLVIAGSGNDAMNFTAKSFVSMLYDPANDSWTTIPTPEDLFCGGHAFLPDGNLLVAGGTRRYEVLPGDVTKAAGVMTIKNENPNSGPLTLPKGTQFTSPTGEVFASNDTVDVPPATKTGRGAKPVVTAGRVEVWVEAFAEGPTHVVPAPAQYGVVGLPPDRAHDVYGVADKLTMDKQDYQGLNISYEFNVHTERYEKVANLTESRWYPTLVGRQDGNVMAVSGLDQFGRILQGQNELYDRATRQWLPQPQLNRYFPTYPALFLMNDGRLFYSGSNSGYGPDNAGRQPGIWNLDDNGWEDVLGLRAPQDNETSASVMLPPAQNQRVMILGGGGVGESHESTARTDIVDLTSQAPRYMPSADLAEPTRYLNTVVLPDDTVLATGGSRDYRGESGSDNHITRIYDPRTDRFLPAADPTVGRDYHSEALLLPDGRVMTLGSNPLYSDNENTTPATFEQRIEIYSPPYLFHGPRPTVTGGPTELPRGAPASFATSGPGTITSAKLIRPSAVTHVTDVEQRSVALPMARTPGGITVDVPPAAGLLPSGWYMLFVTGTNGVPSVARWVHVP